MNFIIIGNRKLTNEKLRNLKDDQKEISPLATTIIIIKITEKLQSEFQVKLFTGFPAKDETIKTTRNSKNMTI